MNNIKLIEKVQTAFHHQREKRGYVAPVDVLMDMGVLSKQKYEDWRFGKIPYLEQVCTCNLRKLSVIMKEIRSCAQKSDLKPSFCFYKQWGQKEKRMNKAIPLRFSKSGYPDIERQYATHYVDHKRIEGLKEGRRV